MPLEGSKPLSLEALDCDETWGKGRVVSMAIAKTFERRQDMVIKIYVLKTKERFTHVHSIFYTLPPPPLLPPQSKLTAVEKVNVMVAGSDCFFCLILYWWWGGGGLFFYICQPCDELVARPGPVDSWDRLRYLRNHLRGKQFGK